MTTLSPSLSWFVAIIFLWPSIIAMAIVIYSVAIIDMVRGRHFLWPLLYRLNESGLSLCIKADSNVVLW